MQKWEYMFVHCMFSERNVQYVQRINDVEQKNPQKGIPFYQYANRLGDEGWELVGVGDVWLYIFKRPKP